MPRIQPSSSGQEQGYRRKAKATSAKKPCKFVGISRQGFGPPKGVSLTRAQVDILLVATKAARARHFDLLKFSGAYFLLVHDVSCLPAPGILGKSESRSPSQKPLRALCQTKTEGNQQNVASLQPHNQIFRPWRDTVHFQTASPSLGLESNQEIGLSFDMTSSGVD